MFPCTVFKLSQYSIPRLRIMPLFCVPEATVPADAKTTFAKLAGFGDHQRLGIAGRS